uniref:BZIP domain-containing protein n=1 Tax=Plectus sambesii TaxID=2011161 RepID=A0A914W8K1_9BILA
MKRSDERNAGHCYQVTGGGTTGGRSRRHTKRSLTQRPTRSAFPPAPDDCPPRLESWVTRAQDSRTRKDGRQRPAAMAGPYDADDFMRRSFFNTLLSYKGCKKIAPLQPSSRGPPANNQGATYQPNFRNAASTNALPLLQHLQPQQTATFLAPSSVTLTDTYVAGDAIIPDDIVVTPLPLERTELDIYREIVCECAEIERQHSPNGSEYSSPQSPQLCQHCHCEKTKREAEAVLTPPPSVPGGATVSIEDFVKLVVTAVRESGVLGGMPQKAVDGNANDLSESPELILQRKRQQNNEAAARYRKRQRHAKEVADGELQELEEKNKELKDTVEKMQEEIDRLKAAVLGSRDTETRLDSCLS